MESRAKLFGHPVHQMLITFPIGGFGFSVVGDALHTLSGRREHADAARQALNFGLASAALAVPFGLVDWLAIDRGTRAKRIGLWHALGNVAMLGLFATSRLLRGRGSAPTAAKLLAGGGLALGGVTAWLGGELIVRHGIGVHDRIGQDERSSLFGSRAGARLSSAEQRLEQNDWRAATDSDVGRWPRTELDLPDTSD
jgi:uncharacterized membrane protein